MTRDDGMADLHQTEQLATLDFQIESINQEAVASILKQLGESGHLRRYVADRRMARIRWHEAIVVAVEAKFKINVKPLVKGFHSGKLMIFAMLDALPSDVFLKQHNTRRRSL